jgi:hypothetical protein
MSHQNSSSKESEEDVVELRKALATGSAQAKDNSTILQTQIASVLAYCVASILMTVVNKVCSCSCQC